MFSRRAFHLFRKNRLLSTLSTQEVVVAEPLDNRGLLRLAGADVCDFLQGLMTNDVSHVQSGMSAMYSVFLSTRGRILYDTIIYRTTEPEVLFVECDNSIKSHFVKHLSNYRLRKKVDIEMYEHYRIWAVYHPSEDELSRTLVDDVKGKLLGKVLPCGELELKRKDKEENLVIKSNSSASNTFIFRDPRLHELGLRVVCPTSEDVPQLLGVTRGSSYRHFRYSLGVGEGAHDIIPEESLPLESNCDYLHGISFHKGCYIGQELTARAYHTGVIRKRLMPITLESSVVEADAIKRGMICNNGRPVARVRGVDGLIALGLVRILDSMSAKTLTVCNTKASTRKPSWWPKSAPKELESRE